LVFNSGALGLANGSIDWGADVIRARLSPTVETLLPTTTSMVDVGLPATDIILSGTVGPMVDEVLDRVRFSASNFQFLFAPAGIECDKVVVYHDASGTPLAAIRLNPPVVGPPVNVTVPVDGLFWLQQVTSQ
jgi:hypothetical protein